MLFIRLTCYLKTQNKNKENLKYYNTQVVTFSRYVMLRIKIKESKNNILANLQKATNLKFFASRENYYILKSFLLVFPKLANFYFYQNVGENLFKTKKYKLQCTLFLVY